MAKRTQKGEIDLTRDQWNLLQGLKVGECIDIDVDFMFGDDGEKISSRVSSCRISDDKWELEGKHIFGEEEPMRFRGKITRRERKVELEE